MGADHPNLPEDAPWSVTRVFYPADDYRHPASGLVQLRVIRRGSSYADIDLGLGTRRVFTRPGDLLLSLPDRPTAFRIDDGRELTLLQVAPVLALEVLRRAGGRTLEELTPLLRRPARDTVIVELIRRLEGGEPDTPTARYWALGLVFANLRRLAHSRADPAAPPRLPTAALEELLAHVTTTLDEGWTVQQLAERVGLPRRTFAAAFKEATGMTVHQHLLRLRTDSAVELLRTTELPIAEIAHRVGFANQAHMTRIFNQLRRITPGQIRAGQSSVE